jgi:hypothetical protein
MVALFAVCIAGIIVSHAVAPTSAAAVVSLVSASTGFVFAALKKESGADETAEPKDKGKQEPPKEAE